MAHEYLFIKFRSSTWRRRAAASYDFFAILFSTLEKINDRSEREIDRERASDGGRAIAPRESTTNLGKDEEEEEVEIIVAQHKRR